MRAAARANLNRKRGGRATWTEAIEQDIAKVMSGIQQLANDPSPPENREPNVREVMNALVKLRQTAAQLAAITDDQEATSLERLQA